MSMRVSTTTTTSTTSTSTKPRSTIRIGIRRGRRRRRARAEIVLGALAVVGEEVVGIGELPESERGSVADGARGLGVLVGMESHGVLAKVLLDLILGRASL